MFSIGEFARLGAVSIRTLRHYDEIGLLLRHIAQEDDMPADDIVVKQIPPLGVVVIATTAPGWGPENIVPAVNHARVKFDQLGISGLVKVAGPFMLFYEQTDGQEVTVNVALPVAGEPAELPPPAHYRVLPAIEAAAAVRSGPAASIYPMVYQDLVAWVQAHGYQPHGPGRDIWIHEVDDISEADQQVFETQLAFTRPAASA